MCVCGGGGGVGGIRGIRGCSDGAKMISQLMIPGD